MSKSLVVKLENGQTRLLQPAAVRLRLGQSRGGQAAQANGLANRFTSETGRKAARKSHGRRSKRTGAVLGRKRKYRPRIDRKALRARHVWWLTAPEEDICYWPDLGVWTDNGQRLSERTALIRLGHLPPRRRMPLPVAVRQPDGTYRALTSTLETEE